MRKFVGSLVFKHVVGFLCTFVVAEAVVFTALYWSTVELYEETVDNRLEDQADSLGRRLAGRDLEEMRAIIRQLCEDEAGENDEYMLATDDLRFLEGNVRRWPPSVVEIGVLVEIDHDSDGHREVHRVLAVDLPGEYRVLVGRNLTALEDIKLLIRRALVQTVLLTLAMGTVCGFGLSRLLRGRITEINRNTDAILGGDLERRMPLAGTGDELDELSANLNRMLDRIETLVAGMREVTENVAHDLRRPLTRLRANVELALLRPDRPEQQREALELALRETDTLLAVFNSLLTIALAESGARRETFAAIDLEEIARAAVEIYGPAAEEAGLDVRLRSTGPVRLRGDRHLIAQALANVLDNAIKYAPGSGALTVTVEATDDAALVSIADRGPGLPAEFRERALERFTRGESSRTTPGSGLGLSLVRAVARLHGGAVTLRDADPGLEVRITLARHAADGPDAAPAAR